MFLNWGLHYLKDNNELLSFFEVALSEIATIILDWITYFWSTNIIW